MAWTIHALFVRHHLRPSVFWSLTRGEQLFLAASIEIEIEDEQKRLEELKNKNG